MFQDCNLSTRPRVFELKTDFDVTTGAFNRLMQMHRQRVFSLAFHVLGDEDEAADVTQDVFIRLWDHRNELEPERIVPWLIRVTRNASIDAYRRRRTRQRVYTSDTESVEILPGHVRSPEGAASASMFRDRLQEALEGLGEPHRSIVVLREIQEYRYEEIGEALGLPLNTVKVYLHRARKSLRAALGEGVRYDYAE